MSKALARFPNLEDQLIDADQAAVILRTTRRYVVREIARKGRLPVVRIDRREYRFWLSDVLRYAEALTEDNPIRPPRDAEVGITAESQGQARKAGGLMRRGRSHKLHWRERAALERQQHELEQVRERQAWKRAVEALASVPGVRVIRKERS